MLRMFGCILSAVTKKVVFLFRSALHDKMQVDLIQTLATIFGFT